jgi:hypothetical protein
MSRAELPGRATIKQIQKKTRPAKRRPRNGSKQRAHDTRARARGLPPGPWSRGKSSTSYGRVMLWACPLPYCTLHALLLRTVATGSRRGPSVQFTVHRPPASICMKYLKTCPHSKGTVSEPFPARPSATTGRALSTSTGLYSGFCSCAVQIPLWQQLAPRNRLGWGARPWVETALGARARQIATSSHACGTATPTRQKRARSVARTAHKHMHTPKGNEM